MGKVTDVSFLVYSNNDIGVTIVRNRVARFYIIRKESYLMKVLLSYFKNDHDKKFIHTDKIRDLFDPYIVGIRLYKRTGN